MTFDACADCGSPVWPLAVLVAFLWVWPAALAALRRHVVPDAEHEARIGRVEVWVTLTAAVITAWLVVR